MRTYPKGTVDKWGRPISDNPAFWVNCMGSYGHVVYTLKRGYMECGHMLMDKCKCDKDLYNYKPEPNNRYQYLLIAS